MKKYFLLITLSASFTLSVMPIYAYAATPCTPIAGGGADGTGVTYVGDCGNLNGNGTAVTSVSAGNGSLTNNGTSLTSAPASSPIAPTQAATSCPNGGTLTNGVCNLGYTPLEPIPGVTSGTNLTSGAGFSNLVNALFKILISAGALLAVLMLTIGGIQYMTSSSIGNKKQGLDRAWAAIYGLLLIAATWLILNTINPKLLNFNFIACPQGSSVCNATATANTSPFGATTVPAAQQVSLTPDQISQAGFAGKTQDTSALLYNNSNLPSAAAVQNYNNTCQTKGGIPTSATVSGQSAFVCETQAAFNSSDQFNNAGAALP